MTEICDKDALYAPTKEVNDDFHAACQEMYNAQNAQEGQAQPNNADFSEQQSSGGGDKQGDVTDVDFKEVK